MHPLNSLVSHFDDYRRLIDEGYKEIQRFIATGEYDLAYELMEASISSQSTTLSNMKSVLDR